MYNDLVLPPHSGGGGVYVSHATRTQRTKVHKKKAATYVAADRHISLYALSI
ncbi:hypothetical protein St703_16330 [Sporolactobacillus terrae]|uniref:Uncharacterized protein n=1 Tax=Sporolactobacillus terrae TaxID=269673 RepID=A0A5K7X1X3_9BACL|nr:hypothetical protein St703_16330 [Sporolactobacillus terrae]